MHTFPHLFRRRAPASSFRLGSRSGFTVVELLLVMGLLMVLVAMTFSGLGAGRDVFDVERAGHEVAAALESAAASARATGTTHYFWIAGKDAVPTEARGRAYGVTDSLSPSGVDWRGLPPDMVFVDPPEPISVVSLAGASEHVEGSFHAVWALTPEGGFAVGPGLEPRSASVDIALGGLLSDPTLEGYGAFSPAEDAPAMRVRLNARPRTGVVDIQVVEP